MGNEALFYEPKLVKYQLQNEQFIDLITLSLSKSSEVYEQVVGHVSARSSRCGALQAIAGGEELWAAANLLSTVLRTGELHILPARCPWRLLTPPSPHLL